MKRHERTTHDAEVGAAAKSPTKPKFHNPHVHVSSRANPLAKTPDQISVGWEDAEENRYHVWLVDTARAGADDTPRSVTGYAVAGGRLYKNPPHGIRSGEVGYFSTRYLDANAKANLRTVLDAIATADIVGALADYDAAERQKAAELAEKRRAIWVTVTDGDGTIFSRQNVVDYDLSKTVARASVMNEIEDAVELVRAERAPAAAAGEKGGAE